MPYDIQSKPNADLKEHRDVITGNPFSVGTGFNALSFKHGMYAGAMDPLIMVDHFVMTEPTFGPHAHAGLSAVSILFEDSQGEFHNQDSLGNDIDLMPGDLYWLKAGRGAVHDEKPRPGARTHALQMFVNLPSRMKYDAPETLHVKASEMPLLEGSGYRARLMLGETETMRGEAAPALPMTILDIKLDTEGRFEHRIASGRTAFILSVEGQSMVQLGNETARLKQGQSVSFQPSQSDDRLILTGTQSAHIVVIEAEPIQEVFVQRGPFAMSTQAEVDAMFAAHKAGELGSLDT